MALQRLQKILAQAGIASRRSAERLILDGRVRVNGRIISELGARANPVRDRVEVDGKRLVAERPVYFLMHKPRGVVTTLDDPEGRQSIADLLRNVSERVFPVGRLDFQTSGALLLTNDGAMTQSLLHPTRRVPKVYHAKVQGTLDAARLELLRNGVTLDDGEQTAPAEVDIVRKDDKHTFIQVTISEGKNRQIHRMLDAVGRVVLRLTRTAFAGLSLDKLRPGEIRALTPSELSDLKQMYLNPGKKVRPDRGAKPYREPEFEVEVADPGEVSRERPGRFERGAVDARSGARAPARGGRPDRGRQTAPDEQRPRKYAVRDERQTPHREDARREPLRARKFGARDERQTPHREDARREPLRARKFGARDERQTPHREDARREPLRARKFGARDERQTPHREDARREPLRARKFGARDERQTPHREDARREPLRARKFGARDEQEQRGKFRQDVARVQQQVRGDAKRDPRRDAARDERGIRFDVRRGPRRDPARDAQQLRVDARRGPRRDPVRDAQPLRFDARRGPRRDPARDAQQVRGDLRRGARGGRDLTPDARRQRGATKTDDSRVRADANRSVQRGRTQRGAFPRDEDQPVDTVQPVRKRTRNR